MEWVKVVRWSTCSELEGWGGGIKGAVGQGGGVQ